MGDINKLIDGYRSACGYSRVAIKQCADEISQVKDYLGDRKFNNMVEGGSYYGGSFWLYANLFLNMDGGTFTCIDVTVRRALYRIADYLKNRNNVKINIIQDRMTNVDIKDIDFVHIDGIHNYKNITADFNHFYPRVVKGGVILLHDTALYVDLIRFRKELEDSGKYNIKTFTGTDLISKKWPKPNFDIVEKQESTGITVIIK